MNFNFIAVEGNIGSGKTTLTHKLADHYGGQLLLEKFEDNTFLPKFYAEPERYAFPLELSFLAERYQQLNQKNTSPNLFSDLIISDYFLSKSLIFARTNLSEEEFRLFWQLFDIMFQSVTKPDLLIYLYAPVEKLIRNINRRGRPYEQNIQTSYLERIQLQYLEFLRKNTGQLRVLVIDTSELDFVANASDFESILSQIEKPLSK